MTDSWTGIHELGDHSVDLNQDGSKLRRGSTIYVRQDLLDQALEVQRETLRGRDSLREQYDDLAHEVEQLETERDTWREEASTKREVIRTLTADRDDLLEKVERLTDINAELSQQVEDLSVSPLTLEQHRRSKALAIAREVAKSTSWGSTKVDGEGLLHLARFIIGDEVDPETFQSGGDGE